MILTGIRLKVFITLMLALAVAGCSRDDVPDIPSPSTSTKSEKMAEFLSRKGCKVVTDFTDSGDHVFNAAYVFLITSCLMMDFFSK